MVYTQPEPQDEEPEPEPEDPVLDVREGVVCCGKCGKGERGLAMPLSPGALAALRRALYGEAKRLYSFSLAGPDLKKLGDASEAYVHAMLERGFKTLDFYKGLAGNISGDIS